MSQLTFKLTPIMLSLATAGSLFVTTQVHAAESFTEALTGGQANGDFRLRYEGVAQDGKDDATALTARLRLGYMTGDYYGVKAFLEFENTTALIDDYSTPGVPNEDYAVVADPEGSEVNQAFLQYGGIADTTVKLGRQRVILDNARFVGNVGWRNNEQTFNALTIANTSLADTTLIYGYVDKVNGIVFNEIDTSAHLLNASYKGLAAGTVTAYGYLLGFDDTSNDTQTWGASFKGGTEVAEDTKLLYGIEYAMQSDYDDGESFEANYLLAEIGGEISGITAKLSYEVLGSDNGDRGFDTPLATKHAFNGWADAFLLGTPPTGLVDTYLTVSGKAAGVKLMAVYHDYASDEGSDDLGSEINLLAAKKFGKNYSALLKYADYSAGDSGKADTQKLWLMGAIAF